jgi:pyruvate-ferredoxin/flavodoxin oxidoreductase
MAVQHVSRNEQPSVVVSEESVKYPGIPGTSDGASMVVYIHSHGSEGGCAYPITPSTAMGVAYQLNYANGMKNVWGTPLTWVQAESEHSAASACEGFGVAGGRVVNFTSGQGLILMKEVLYTISGKRLPIVFEIGARALTSHSLNVHAGHDDVFGVTDVGWGMLFAQNAQEAGDFSLICRRVAEASQTPFMNIQDGFLTTHTIENVLFPETDFIRDYLGDPREKINTLFHPDTPLMSGVVQNQDAYMSGKVAQRFYYDLVKPALREAFDEFKAQTGRAYDFIQSYQMEDAEFAIIALGSTAETAQSTVDYIRSLGYKAGSVAITSYRPFPGAEIVEALKNVKAFSVLERLDIPLGGDNPLTSEIKAAFANAMIGEAGYPAITRIPTIYSGVAGLGSRDVTPGHMVAVIENMAKEGRRFFSLGIDHITGLEVDSEPDVRPAGAFSIRGHSVGGYGSVTTNKIIATILGDVFGLRVQASPKYGSEKKGLPTNTYLTCTKIGKIGTHSELQQVEFVPLMDPTTWAMGNPLVGLQKGGMLFQHTPVEDPKLLWESLPLWAKYVIREENIRVFGVDTIRIAREACQSDESLIQRFQGIVLLGVFLKLTPFKDEAGLSDEDLFEAVRKPIKKYFGRKGDQVVQDNLNAVIKGYQQVFEVSRELMDTMTPEEIERGRCEWDAKGKDTNAFFI